jgi:Tol biopolymer transport system component
MRSHTNLLTVVTLICAGMAVASSQQFPLQHVQPLTYLVDYEANWSPDGRQIVLISNRHGGMKVHLLDSNRDGKGSDMRQISYGPDEDDSPAWSPDGRRIAFVSIHAGVSDIFVMGSDGKNVRQVTRGIGQNIHPMWTPDGQRILFNTTFFARQATSNDNEGDERRVIGEKRDDSIDLATIRTDGQDLRQLTQGGGFTYASYSPDGKFILHRHQRSELSQIFVMNADGSGDHNLSGAYTTDGWPAWSPDGRMIVFSRHVANGLQIFVMNSDGSAARQLTDAPGEFTNPRWSPDGKKILCGRRLGGISLIVFDAPN